jgi:hypothetical protein
MGFFELKKHLTLSTANINDSWVVFFHQSIEALSQPFDAIWNFSGYAKSLFHESFENVILPCSHRIS